MTIATTSRALAPGNQPPEYRYHLLRAAIERFGRGLPALNAAQRAEAEARAVRTFALEERVLASTEAQEVVIPATQLAGAVARLADRYQSHGDFLADLAANGLDEGLLGRALQRELIFDAVLRRVGARHEPVDEADVRRFYELNRERFTTTERRTARHILITINDAFPENRREVARARLQALAAALADPQAAEPLVERFADTARRHSECPTAVDGGSLGQVRPGQLFSALDSALFALTTGALSGLCESPLGYHLLLCEAIAPAVTHDFAALRERLYAALQQRRRRESQRAWLAALGGEPPT